jgi:integrase
MFNIAWHLGLRYGEVLKLDKRKFYPEQRKIIAERFKTDDITDFEYQPDFIIEMIQEAVDASSDPVFIFPHKTTHPNIFYERMKEAIEAAGLPYGRGAKFVSFHSCRHSYTTRLSSVADIGTTQSFTAHTDAEMAALYSHAQPEARKRAMERMHGKRDLKEIFDKVRSKKMDFETFKKAVDS